jgi:DNA repair protein RadC
MAPRLATHIEAFAVLAALETERLDVAYLDRGNTIVRVNSFSDGFCDRVNVRFREIFSEALSLDAAGLVIAHNHPSGRAEPSRRDYAFTRRLAQIAEPLDLRLLDHLIYAGNKHFSFRETGLL